MDEPSGTRRDSIRQPGNDLIDNALVTGNLGPANFNRSSQFTVASSKFLSCPSNNSLQVSAFDFTWAFWMFLDANNINQVIIGKDIDSPTASRDYTVECVSNTFKFYTNGGSFSQTVTAAETLSASVWYFVVAWNDSIAQTLNISINNAAPTVGVSYTSIPPYSATDLNIGRRAYAGFQEYFGGRICRMGFWKRKLSTLEISVLYNNGYGLSYRELVARSSQILLKRADRRFAHTFSVPTGRASHNTHPRPLGEFAGVGRRLNV